MRAGIEPSDTPCLGMVRTRLGYCSHFWATAHLNQDLTMPSPMPSQPRSGSWVVQALPQALCSLAVGLLGIPCCRPSLHLRKTLLPFCHKVQLKHQHSNLLWPHKAHQILQPLPLRNHPHSQSPLLLSGATTGPVSRTSGFLLFFLCPPHPTILAAP